MKVKGIISEDFVNYKKICMTIEMPYCTFKCDRDCGQQICQNSSLTLAPTHNILDTEIITMYKNNNITDAICFQGLEPFDSPDDLRNFVHLLRHEYNIYDDIVIYTGYTKEELEPTGLISRLKAEAGINLIIKYGRFVPGCEKHFDEVLGVYLSSDNQYAERIC